MSDSFMENENPNSFNLKKKNRQDSSADKSAPFTWQERAYERLKVLYGVSKLLSSVNSVEIAFPKILDLCSSSFPLVTAILIEKRGQETKAEVWHSENASPQQIKKAHIHAEKSFAFLTGHPKDDSLPNDHVQELAFRQEKFFDLPLVVDSLPAFGIIQLEGHGAFDEKDLEFADALSRLIAVAVDRYHKSNSERELRQRESAEKSSKLLKSQEDVADLQKERELRESFVSLLTHDLRTPLSAAKVSAQLIQQQSDNAEISQSLAERIVSNVNRADQMITDLLDANLVRSGFRIQLNLESFNFTDLVKDTLHELAAIHGERFVIQGSDSVVGFWDRKSFRRVIENLCTNAIKYGYPESLVTVSVSQTETDACLEVHNRGEVISKEDQCSMFQQFRRGRQAQSGSKKGWGIGLTLVRGVTEAHGGHVQLKSEQDMGTVFAVTLPLDSRISKL